MERPASPPIIGAGSSGPTVMWTSSSRVCRALGALLAWFMVLAPVRAEPWRILHVMSYEAGWDWNQDQLRGFLEGFGPADIELKVVELDAKHRNDAQVKAAAQQAFALIEQWKPHLVYANDDVAQSEVTVRYLNTALPFVYSGVNLELRDYGFDRARNVTGVLEREHFAGTIALLRELRPKSRLRLAIVVDDDPTWLGVVARIRQELERRSDIEVLHWLQPRTFAAYRNALLELQDQVDAVGLLGIFRFRRRDGSFADYEEVLRWTAENSRLPDFSFWDTRVERGTLVAVTVSGLEQGRLAGRMARRILVDGVPPAAIPAEPTAKGRPMISLARARQLGIAIDARVLLGAEVLPRFAWER